MKKILTDEELRRILEEDDDFWDFNSESIDEYVPSEEDDHSDGDSLTRDIQSQSKTDYKILFSAAYAYFGYYSAQHIHCYKRRPLQLKISKH